MCDHDFQPYRFELLAFNLRCEKCGELKVDLEIAWAARPERPTASDFNFLEREPCV